MKRDPSIPLKALFLLVVFLLNTVVGFACVIGLESNHDRPHQEHKDAVAIHQHEHHDQDSESDHHTTQKAQDNCCKDDVTTLLKTDKISPTPVVTTPDQTSFIALLPVFLQIDALASFKHQPNTRYFVRSYHPPIPDIRISIQSFQI